MDDRTASLALPFIMPDQAQKHVTSNEALRTLDALLQIAVEDRGRQVPPEGPAEGDRHILGDDPTGAFEGRSGALAVFQDGAWSFHEPRAGWVIWDRSEAALLVFDGAAWLPAAAPGSVATLGVNAAADEINRLVVSAAATLLDHEGEGHRLKINKADASATASLLYQSAYSGRAEMGLAGDDDFAVKVSADGALWKTALSVAGESAAVRIDRLGIGTSAPVGDLHLSSERATGFDPHLLIRSGKNPGAAASVAYQRAEAGQQMLFAFETGSSASPDGYVGTLPGKAGTVYILAGFGAGDEAALAIDRTLGLRIGTAGNIVSGTPGGGIGPAGDGHLTSLSIGAEAPDASAALDIADTTRGFLPPRLSRAERDAIAAPATGLMIFDTTEGKPHYWNGSAWIAMG